MIQTGIWLLCILNDVVSVGSMWNMSPFTGSHTLTHTTGIILTRSLIECVFVCASDPTRCKSVEFKKGSKECTLVNSKYQDKGPYTKREDVVHFSTNEQTLCPYGYNHLPISGICVKEFTDKLNWNDSLAACKNEGADLPILDTDQVFLEFKNYMDSLIHLDDRVAVNARLVNNWPIWGNGVVVDSRKFCTINPSMRNTPDVCIYIVHKTESWCDTAVDRFDDALCDDYKPRICVINL